MLTFDPDRSIPWTREAPARIMVAGTGPAGLIAALGSPISALPVTLLGPPRPDDRRTTALMRPALALPRRARRPAAEAESRRR